MNPRSVNSVSVACFGEALWDILPRGIFLGGAPLNVAYHLSRQGVQALPITALGRDFLGDEALRRISAWGLDTRFIVRCPNRPTGTVRATLDGAGAARYRIARGVAWDAISVSRVVRRPSAPAALVFGTLALRENQNRRSFAKLVAAWPDAVRVLDLNLRAPFDRPAPVAFALRHARIVKLNDEELALLHGSPLRSVSQLKNAAQEFATRHALAGVCVTAGARGAGLWWDAVWTWEGGRRVKVRDTVGAGDAFLGALLAGLLARRAAPAEALATACRVGEFVAARDGATPPYRCDARGRPHDAA